MTTRYEHFIIPDTQAAKGHPVAHMRWIGEAIKEYKPDVLVHLGDHWDMPSASSWSPVGSKSKEGSRLYDDIEAGNEALDILEQHMAGFIPRRKVILRGNHEHRLSRVVENDPKLDGVLGEHLFNDVAHGWEVIPYFNGSPKGVDINGVMYAHYFANPNTGKPISGTIQNRLNKIGTSFVQGHQQGLLQGNIQYATGNIKHGIVAGSAYLHDEPYKGMANSHWRGVIVLNEVKDGQFCEMPLTLDYLCRKYEGMSLSRFMNRNYRNAKDRFTVANE